MGNCGATPHMHILELNKKAIYLVGVEARDFTRVDVKELKDEFAKNGIKAVVIRKVGGFKGLGMLEVETEDLKKILYASEAKT